jgi:hypothetical protein
MSKKEVMYLRVSPEAKAWAERKAQASKGLSANVVVEKLLLADKNKHNWGKKARAAKKTQPQAAA